MTKDLQQKLVKKYPKVFENYGGDPRHTCMAWGICTGDGWYNIIDELCSKLEPFEIVAEQIKEKFGGLRFYVGAVPTKHSDEIFGYIREAEKKSLETCEICGKPGKRKGGDWIRTLCKKCSR